MGSFGPIRPKSMDGFHLDPQQSTISIPGQRNISKACGHCREKKKKCDGRQPSCSSCINLKKICTYGKPDMRRKEAWRSKIDDLQQRNNRLENIVGSLQCNSYPEAVWRLQQLRADRFLSPKRKEFVTIGSDGRSDDGSDGAPREDDCSDSPRATPLLMNLPQVKSISLNNQLFKTPANGYEARSPDSERDSLPPQFLTRRAISAYFVCGSALFYIMQREACEKLIRTVYEQPADITKSDTCGLCALAAVGSLYHTDELPDFAHKKYFQYASSLLQDTVRTDFLMGMRVSACLSVYLVLDKSTSARATTASGLNIARCNMRKWMTNTSHEDRLEWARVLRTLAFMECWLSSTFGYTFELRTEEISLLEELAISESTKNPLKSFCSSLVQSHMFELVLLSAQLNSQAQHAAHLTNYELDQLSAKLDTWHEGLPESLHLRQLVSGNRADLIRAKRPLLFMHMAHISARITLYERMIQAAQNQQTSTSYQSMACHVLSLPEDIHQVYTSFAQQLARIIALLYEEQGVLVRCPITIHACFHSSVVLLLGVAQNLALGVCHNLALEHLSNAQTCLLALEVCREHDIVAIQLDCVITPIYEHLNGIAHDSTGLVPSQTDYTEGSTLPAIHNIVCRLMSVMAISFKELWV